MRRKPSENTPQLTFVTVGYSRCDKEANLRRVHAKRSGRGTWRGWKSMQAVLITYCGQANTRAQASCFLGDVLTLYSLYCHIAALSTRLSTSGHEYLRPRILAFIICNVYLYKQPRH